MSHEVETMAWAGETPWHGLGVKVSNDLTTDEMLVASGLDWEVKKSRLVAEIGGKRYPAPKNAQGLYRVNKDGTYDGLSVISKGWEPVQNSEAFAFFHEYVEAGEMEMHTAGSLKNGRIVWVLAKIKESFEAVKGDVIDNYLLFTNPHQYGQSIDVRMTPIRVVCWNTMSMALQKSATSNTMVKLDHRKAFDAESVKETLGIAKSHFHDYQETAKYLASRPYEDETVSEYFNLVFPRTSDAKGKAEPSKMHDRAMGILSSQPGAEFAPGTWWQALNAATFLMDHEMGPDKTRLESAWYGHNRGRKLKAMALATKMAA